MKNSILETDKKTIFECFELNKVEILGRLNETQFEYEEKCSASSNTIIFGNQEIMQLDGTINRLMEGFIVDFCENLGKITVDSIVESINKKIERFDRQNSEILLDYCVRKYLDSISYEESEVL